MGSQDIYNCWNNTPLAKIPYRIKPAPLLAHNIHKYHYSFFTSSTFGNTVRNLFKWMGLTLYFHPSALPGEGGVLSNLSGRAAGWASAARHCGTHIAETIGWIFYIHILCYIELPIPEVVQNHCLLPICCMWIWYQRGPNLRNAWINCCPQWKRQHTLPLISRRI